VILTPDVGETLLMLVAWQLMQKREETEVTEVTGDDFPLMPLPQPAIMPTAIDRSDADRQSFKDLFFIPHPPYTG
jgi:hypothetical protein